MLPNDLPPWSRVHQQMQQSTPTSGARAGYDEAKRKKGAKVHLAVDPLGNLLALHLTPANEQAGSMPQTSFRTCSSS